MKTKLTGTVEPADRRDGRRRWPWAVGGVGAALLVVVLVWFQPQKLLIDERVDDAAPTASRSTLAPPISPSGQPAAPSTTAPAAAQAVDVALGRFVSLDHGTTGSVRVLRLEGGRRVVRLERLDTDNGPDLYLYLSATPAGGSEQAFDDDFVSLGRLKGNKGDQNYELPSGTDLARYRSVVIWCDRFNSAFGAADLAAV